MIDVLCIGYACHDLIYYPDLKIRHNRKHFIQITDESGGGPAANAAYLLSKWGVSTAIACLIGNDHEGNAVLDEFMSVGTDIFLVTRMDGFRTPFSSIIIDPETGDRTIFTRHSEPPLYSPDRERLSVLSPKVILADGHQLEATVTAHKMYPDAALVLDAGSLREATGKLLSITTAALCSEPFACAVSGQEHLQTIDAQKKALRRIHDKCPADAAITLGEQGIVYMEKGSLRHIPAYRVNAVDTTAAGDIFHGAFVYAHLQNKSFSDCLRFAAAAAALSVTKRGGRNSIPELDEVVKFINS